MMTRGLGAKIAQVLNVPFPRPRRQDTIDQQSGYHALKAEMVHHLSYETRAVEQARV